MVSGPVKLRILAPFRANLDFGDGIVVTFEKRCLRVPQHAQEHLRLLRFARGLQSEMGQDGVLLRAVLENTGSGIRNSLESENDRLDEQATPYSAARGEPRSTGALHEILEVGNPDFIDTDKQNVQGEVNPDPDEQDTPSF